MAKISITRALTEVGTLGNRIAQAINSSAFVRMSKGRNDKMIVSGSNQTVAAAEEQIKREFQSVKDLIERRKVLKAAIGKSNQITMVKIADVEMTVAEAVERKQSIMYERQLFEKMRNDYANVANSVERGNLVLNDQIEKAVLAAYNNEKNRVSPEQYDAVANPRKDEHQLGFINPLKLDVLLPQMMEELNNFVVEVDFVLSESNARTEIEV